MKNYLLTIVGLLLINVALAQNEFITTWKTDNPGTSNDDQITIPTTGIGYNYDISWEEVGNEAGNNGSEPAGQTGDYTITFPSAGTYRISITGDFPRIYFNNSGDKEKILTIEGWGDIEWSTLDYAFYGCFNLTSTATDAPDLTNSPILRGAFRFCTVFNGDLSNWDVSNVTDMSYMFQGAQAFNQNISGWNTSEVLSMRSMFSSAGSFNQDISNWNTSKVTNMEGMFYLTPFNIDIGDWDVSNVNYMGSMFSNATSFNQDIGDWDVSSVQDMSFMFQDADAFNQDISMWDVGNVLDMGAMFSSANNFNSYIGNWNTSKVTDMRAMFNGSSFNRNISGWDVSKVTTLAYMFTNTPFNQDISGWDVAMVEDMEAMFAGNEVFNNNIGSWNTGNLLNSSIMFADTDAFNQDLSSWDMSKVTTMDRMFLRAAAFNGNVSTWNVSLVNNMANMFDRATNFNQNLSEWDVSNVTTMIQMFDQTSLNTTNYDKILEAWSALSVQSGVNLGASGINYCHSSAERDVLTNAPNNWTITDAGQECLPFVTTWKTDNTGTSNDNQITIPTTGTGYNYDVDWGDGSSDIGVTGDITHTYSSAGTYTVSITGDFPRIYFNFGGDEKKLMTIEAWGDIAWTSMERAFGGCSNLVYNATDAPDLTNVTSLHRTFAGCTNFNGAIGNWNTETITNMSHMFIAAPAFNQDISGWNTNNVINMQAMFRQASSFDQDISGWNTENVINMNHMFYQASSFNQDLSAWNTANVEVLNEIFFGATSFNQNLSSWDISTVTQMSNMFNNSGLSTLNYDKILTGWAAQTVQSGVTFGASGIEYCLGADGRNTLETTHSWTITDAGENCVVNIPDTNFKDALLADININTDEDSEITYQEAEAYSGAINVINLGINDLTGIEAFTNITGLNCSINNLSSIDVSKNVFLESLRIGGNNISEINVSNNNALTDFIITDCPISAVDISNNTLLTTFTATNNQLSSINLSNNTELLVLSLSNNSLSSIDLSSNTKLSNLRLEFNELSSLDLSTNTMITQLRVANNPLTALEVSALPNLTTLYADNTEIEELDVSANSSLHTISLINGSLTSLNVANGNNTNFVGFTVRFHPDLSCITVDDFAFSESNWSDPNNSANFSTDCNVVDIPDANFKNELLDNTEINTNEDAFIQVTEANDFTGHINVTTRGIDDMTGLEAFVNITNLSCSNNQLENLDVSNNTKLTTLTSTNNVFTSLDVSSLSELEILFIGSNNLSAIDVSQNPELRLLEVQDNPISVLDVSANPELTRVRAYNTSITSLDLTANTNLNDIRLEDNNLESLNIQNGNNSALSTFNITNNPNLTCVTVDDVANAEANFSEIDETANFSTNCANLTNDITAFSFAEQAGAATIGTGTIDIEVVLGTDLSALTPSFTVSSGATADPASGITQDFSNAFIYTVSAENPTAIQEWTVNVTEENVAPTDIALDNNSIDENNEVQDVIGEFSSTDANAISAHTYSLVAGEGDTDNASFDIAGNQLRANEVFDFETKTTYSIRLQTDDGNGGVFEKEFTISINNLEDAIQTITFEEIPNATYGDAAFDLNATSTSGLTVSFTSSNENVATIDGSTVTIVGAGSTDITALQSGNEDYAAAESVVKTFTVEKAEQTVTFSMQESVSYGAEAIALSAVASSELAVDFTSSDESVARISEGNLIIVGVGTVEISAIQAGSTNYLPAEQTRELIVTPAQLTVTADNKSIIYGDEFPEFTYSISGFVYDEDESVLETLPVAATDATNLSDVGEYTISVSGGVAANYTFDYITAVLTIEKSDQEITIESISDKFVDAADFEVIATTTSELELVFTVLSGPATISDNLVSLTGEIGFVEIEVSQAGNVNYNETTASISFEVIDPCLGFEANSTVIQNVSCNGEANGSFEVTTSNGTAPFTFSLGSEDQENGLFENMTAGSYEIIVSDVNGCSATTTIEITEPELLEANATVIQNVSCNGETDGSFEVSTINGIAPFTYSIGNESQDNGLFENMGTGNYEVTVIDANGCSATTTVEVTEPEALEITAETTESNSIFGNGSISLTVTGGTGNYTYNWSNGEATVDLSDLEIGEYSVTVTDEAGCSITESFTIGGVTANSEVFEVNIYPNPVINQVEIAHGEKVNQITLIDAKGKIISQNKTEGKQTRLDMKALPAGMYFIRLDNGKMNRIIKQ